MAEGVAHAATATDGRDHLIQAPVPGGVETATGMGPDLSNRVHTIALTTGWLRPDDVVRYQMLLVDMPRWVATTMDLGLYDDPDDPEWHGQPIEPYNDVETYKAPPGASRAWHPPGVRRRSTGQCWGRSRCPG
ncbi:hypothetical protein OG535_39885 [Kitasatospora sp. NBC_00085]|uniref:hypothetical protein n=1 Tax=unclassified Kitasatospora TaxID=2633591 RepID=UPI003255D504